MFLLGCVGKYCVNLSQIDYITLQHYPIYLALPIINDNFAIHCARILQALNSVLMLLWYNYYHCHQYHIIRTGSCHKPYLKGGVQFAAHIFNLCLVISQTCTLVPGECGCAFIGGMGTLAEVWGVGHRKWEVKSPRCSCSWPYMDINNRWIEVVITWTPP